MHLLYFVLLLIGVICFIASAFQAQVRRIDLISIGLAFVFAVPLIMQGKLL